MHICANHIHRKEAASNQRLEAQDLVAHVESLVISRKMLFLFLTSDFSVVLAQIEVFINRLRVKKSALRNLKTEI